MKLSRSFTDETGTAAIEFAMTSWVYVFFLMAIIEGGFALRIQAGIQHGSEMAARCATVDSTTCGSTSAIQTYAAAQSYGLNPPTSTFTVSTPACGNRVSASYTLTFLTHFFNPSAVTLTGSSCFPK
jgi:Flp pilus assembly protein TadG